MSLPETRISTKSSQIGTNGKISKIMCSNRTEVGKSQQFDLTKEGGNNLVISLSLARQLKAAGLSWTPTKNDFFAIPERDLDDSIFVINDMTAVLGLVNGRLAVSFHGALEWALDYVMTAELVWLPTESQLRELLEQRLVGQSEPVLTLTSTPDGYRCEIQYRSEILSFEGFGVSEVYGQALLHVLENEPKL